MPRNNLLLMAIVNGRRRWIHQLLAIINFLLLGWIEIQQQYNRPDSYCVMSINQKIVGQFLDGTLDMKAHIRVTRQTFFALEAMLAPQTHGWSMSFRLFIFLFWLGCGTSYRVISVVFNVSTSTVHNIVHNTMNNVLASLQNKVICYPSMDKIADVGRGFGRLARSQTFNNAVGAIDGCHVKVRVTGPNKQDYFNRKLDYSVQFQAVVDDKGMFINIYAGYPGSVHDSRVLRSSTLYRNREYPPQGYFLLGDGGYPLLNHPVCLLTPYRNPHPNQEEKIQFNLFHSRARSIVERAFGMLKARWRTIFMKTVEIHHTKVARLIAVCCIMHNVCMSLGDILQPIFEPVDAENGEVNEPEEDEEAAIAYRDHLARRLNIVEQLF